MKKPIDSVAIVGGGFSGAMLAARLAERGTASTLINRSADFGLGVAYSTPFDGHLLNVRSGRMSAIADRPDDFVAWLTATHPSLADPDGFAPRRLFGAYVQSRLATVEAARPGLIRRVVGEVAAIAPRAVGLADGELISAGAVVLTTGNPAPKTAGATDAGGPVIADPWGVGALDRIGAEDTIVLIGTGLTMVDVLLLMDARGWRGRATALSRRGLLPRGHAVQPDGPLSPTPRLLTGSLSRRLHEARRLADAGGWREVMEGLRPITADLWTRADRRTRGQIVRHLRPWWDVHRHRVAPAVALVTEGLRAAGRLEVLAGRVKAVSAGAHDIQVDWTPRHATACAPLTGRWLVNCTGPGHAPEADPLIMPLLASGRARLDPLRLGLDLDPRGRVLNTEGLADPRLYVLGPPARAAFWETIAVPDIRKRIEDVVAALAGQA